ncbi:hypothetical protein DYB32_006176 [Aphanomyces invadans]|uniref:Uncharacterized protein n=1 Tax=Aphanomyces invadans TaxID=157072 RepID=A0A418ASM3_9STRA|nr:hypothetical protein DYB32_006176 [Aphanomyces invadans]
MGYASTRWLPYDVPSLRSCFHRNTTLIEAGAPDASTEVEYEDDYDEPDTSPLDDGYDDDQDDGTLTADAAAPTSPEGFYDGDEFADAPSTTVETATLSRPAALEESYGDNEFMQSSGGEDSSPALPPATATPPDMAIEDSYNDQDFAPAVEDGKESNPETNFTSPEPKGDAPSKGIDATASDVPKPDSFVDQVEKPANQASDAAVGDDPEDTQSAVVAEANTVENSSPDSVNTPVREPTTEASAGSNPVRDEEEAAAPGSIPPSGNQEPVAMVFTPEVVQTAEQEQQPVAGHSDGTDPWPDEAQVTTTKVDDTANSHREPQESQPPVFSNEFDPSPVNNTGIEPESNGGEFTDSSDQAVADIIVQDDADLSHGGIADEPLSSDDNAQAAWTTSEGVTNTASATEPPPQDDDRSAYNKPIDTVEVATPATATSPIDLSATAHVSNTEASSPVALEVDSTLPHESVLETEAVSPAATTVTSFAKSEALLTFDHSAGSEASHHAPPEVDLPRTTTLESADDGDPDVESTSMGRMPPTSPNDMFTENTESTTEAASTPAEDLAGDGVDTELDIAPTSASASGGDGQHCRDKTTPSSPDAAAFSDVARARMHPSLDARIATQHDATTDYTASALPGTDDSGSEPAPATAPVAIDLPSDAAFTVPESTDAALASLLVSSSRPGDGRYEQKSMFDEERYMGGGGAIQSELDSEIRLGTVAKDPQCSNAPKDHAAHDAALAVKPDTVAGPSTSPALEDSMAASSTGQNVEPSKTGQDSKAQPPSVPVKKMSKLKTRLPPKQPSLAPQSTPIPPKPRPPHQPRKPNAPHMPTGPDLSDPVMPPLDSSGGMVFHSPQKDYRPWRQEASFPSPARAGAKKKKVSAARPPQQAAPSPPKFHFDPKVDKMKEEWLLLNMFRQGDASKYEAFCTVHKPVVTSTARHHRPSSADRSQARTHSARRLVVPPKQKQELHTLQARERNWVVDGSVKDTAIPAYDSILDKYCHTITSPVVQKQIYNSVDLSPQLAYVLEKRIQATRQAEMTFAMDDHTYAKAYKPKAADVARAPTKPSPRLHPPNSNTPLASDLVSIKWTTVKSVDSNE